MASSFPRIAAFLVFLGVFVPMTSAYGSGAPMGVCVSMTPGHGTPQTNATPYNIDVGDATEYVRKTPIRLTITGGAFKGILLEARRTDNAVIVGTFVDPGVDSHLKLLHCGDTPGIAVTHSSPDPKTNAVLTWNPPESDMGDIIFIATVAQEQLVWWPNVTSTSLAFKEMDPSNGASKGSPVLRVFYIFSLFLAGIFW